MYHFKTASFFTCVFGRALILVAICALVPSCAMLPQPRDPSEYLLSVDRGVSASLKDVRDALIEQKYAVMRENFDAGFLLLKPRQFSYSKNGSKIVAQQIMHIRQEGGSVKIRLAYECRYSQQFDACHIGDKSLEDKITRLELPLLQLIRPLLLRANYNEKDPKNIPSSAKSRTL